MSRRVPLPLGLAAALASSGCAAGGFGDDGGTPHPVSVDLLVLPPLGSALPAQIVAGLSAADVGDGKHDLHLDAGSDVTFHVRSEDLVPIDGAAVRIRMRGAAGYDVVEVTGPSGDVSVPLGAAIYDVEVDPNALLYPGLPPRIFRGVVVPPGGVSQELLLTMEPGYRIRGTVRDDQGATLQQWQVSARREGSTGERSTAATTSMVGAFEIFVPDAGTWILNFSPPALAQGKPVATHRIEVAADVEGYVFQFPSIAAHTITGTVRGIGDLTNDFSNITVRARAPQLLVDVPEVGVTISFNGSTVTDAGGFFTMPVLHGFYALSIEPPPGFAYSHAVIPSLEVTSDVGMLESLTSLYPKVTVSGSAIDVVSTAGTEGARVRLSSADGTTSYQFHDPDGTSASGAFEIVANVGSYTAEVLPAPASGLVRSKQPVTVAAAIADLVLGLHPGQLVRGRVYDPDGDPLDLVTIVALDPQTSLPVGSDETVSGRSGDWALTLPVLATP